MLAIFIILIILVSIVLGLIVLVQNPKGGGLSGSFGGFGNQVMGVKQTTDVLEKGTWVLAGALGFLCIISPLFIPKDVDNSSKAGDIINKTSSMPPTAPANTAPMPGTKSTPQTKP